MCNGLNVSQLWRTSKRAFGIALIGLVLGLLAVPETGLAASRFGITSSDVVPVHAYRPADGVGDSPIMP